MEKEPFDFSKLEDQSKFSQLPQEERDKLVDDAQSAAFNIQKIAKQIKERREVAKEQPIRRIVSERPAEEIKEITQKRIGMVQKDANPTTEDYEKANKTIETLKSELEKGEINLLHVEPTMLMHTGGLYDYLCGKVNPDKIQSFAMPEGRLCFGVCYDSIPEDNTSIVDYRHSFTGDIHHLSNKEVTLIYKKDYHKRLGLESETIEEIEKGQTSGFNGGVNAPARMIYNLEEIDSIICYNEDDARVYAKKLREKGINIPIYIEIKNPIYKETVEQRTSDTKRKVDIEFNEKFKTVNTEGLDVPISVPDDVKLKDFGNISGEFESAVKESAQKLHDELIAAAKAEEERIDFGTYKKRLNSITQTLADNPQGGKQDWESVAGKIREMFRIDDEAKRLFGEKIINREKGIPDDHKVKELKRQAEEVLQREQRLIQYITAIAREGKIPIPESISYPIKKKFEEIAKRSEGPINATRWLYVLFNELNHGMG